MSFRIAQNSEYIGTDHWKWRASIEGEPADLQRVEKVKWFLHPSFTPSVVVSRDRASGFEIEASGWGTFLLRAELRLVDGSEVTLRHHLQLFYPDDETAGAPEKGASAKQKALPPASVGASRGAQPRTETRARGSARPGSDAATGRTVFLSYASEDRERALVLRRALEKLGLSVVDDSQISADSPLRLAALDLLSSADATIAYLSSDVPSAFVAQEVNASVRAGKPTLVVTDGNLGPIMGVDANVPVKQLNANNESEIADTLKALLPAS